MLLFLSKILEFEKGVFCLFVKRFNLKIIDLELFLFFCMDVFWILFWDLYKICYDLVLIDELWVDVEVLVLEFLKVFFCVVFWLILFWILFGNNSDKIFCLVMLDFWKRIFVNFWEVGNKEFDFCCEVLYLDFVELMLVLFFFNIWFIFWVVVFIKDFLFLKVFLLLFDFCLCIVLFFKVDGFCV